MHVWVIEMWKYKIANVIAQVKLTSEYSSHTYIYIYIFIYIYINRNKQTNINRTKPNVNSYPWLEHIKFQHWYGAKLPTWENCRHGKQPMQM